MGEIIKDVLSAEAKAETIVKNAEKKKQDIISQAKQDSLQMILDKQKEIGNDNNKEIENQRKNVVEIKEKIVTAGRNDIDGVGKKSKANFSKAVDYVFGEFKARLKK